MNISFSQTHIGRIGIAEEHGRITNLYFETDDSLRDAEMRETETLKEAFRQLNAYLAGNLREFSLLLAPHGSTFMRRIWTILREVPYGETMSYKDVAIAAGNPKAVRAVGLANSKNPIPIFIPCHRIIGKSGQLVGYGGGLELKRKLLDLERNGDI